MRTKAAKKRKYKCDIRLAMDLKESLGISRCPLITRAADLAHVFKGLAHFEREVLVSGALDCKCRLIRWSLLGVGSMHSVNIRIGDLFQEAIRSGAMGVVLVHNHPSGSLDASAEDHALTKQVKQAGWLLGYPLFDHVIIAGSGFRSLMPRRMDAVAKNSVSVSKAAETRRAVRA